MTRVFMLALALGSTSLAATADTAPPAYAPGLGDFMTAYVQPHHIKLWYAGKAGNWTLAAYEATELRETFGDISTYQADWQNVPVAELVQALIEPALNEVQSAIQAKNAAEFEATYRAMTAACNTCHTTAQKKYIEVEVPTLNPFTDQNFAPH